MTEPEFQTSQDLVLVRQIRYMLDLLESSTNVGPAPAVTVALPRR